MPNGQTSYAVAVLAAGQPTPEGTPVPTNCLYAVCTGFDRIPPLPISTVSRRLGAMFAIVGGTVTLPDGFFLNSSFNLGGGQLQVNGWDELTNTDNASASVGTNATSQGVITLSGGSAIHGSVTIGPGGNISQAIKGLQYVSGGASVSNVYYTLRPPAPPVNLTAYDTTVSGTVVLPPGRYAGMNLSNATVTLLPGDYYFTGNINAGRGTSIIVPAGAAAPSNVYIGGSNFTLNSASLNNLTHQPSMLNLYGTKTTYQKGNQIDINGGSNAYYTVYAPNYDINVTGGSDIYGTVVANSMSASGAQTTLHMDTNIPPCPAGLVIESGSGANNNAPVLLGVHEL
jgi:hypothetical protein